MLNWHVRLRASVGTPMRATSVGEVTWAVRHLVQFPSTSRGRVRRVKIHVISPVEHHLTAHHISFMIYGSSRLSGILS